MWCYVFLCYSSMPTRDARLWVSIYITPIIFSAVHVQIICFFLCYKDREAVQKLEGRVRSERTTCGETVSLINLQILY